MKIRSAIIPIALVSISAVGASPVSAASPARGLELVTPADSRANDVLAPEGPDSVVIGPVRRSSNSGDAVAFQAYGGMLGDRDEGLEGNPYVSTRSATGWVSRFFGPPSTRATSAFVRWFSADLSKSIFEQSRGISADPNDPETGSEPIERLIRQDGVGGPFTRLDNGSTLVGSPAAFGLTLHATTGDGKRALFASPRELEPTPSDALFGGGNLYIRDGVSTTRLPIGGNQPMASADLTKVYVDVQKPGNEKSIAFWDGSGPPTEVGQSRRTTPGPDVPFFNVNPRVMSVSADGTSAILATAQSLVDADNDVEEDLYEFRLPGSGQAAQGTLDLITNGPESGTDAAAALVNASTDHQRVFFVSTERLTTDAVDGEPGLYLRTPTNTELIATLPQGEDTALAQSAKQTTRISSDGNVLVFPSAGAFAGAPGGNSNIFRFDAGSGALDCVSCAAGVTGGESVLSDSPFVPVDRGPNMTSDGRHVFFDSTARLTPDDENDVWDVFEYDAADGSLGRISKGIRTVPARYYSNSADGRDVFFRTRQTLVPQDRNGDGDSARIYDARIGGGFPVDVAPPACTGDACRGPLYERPGGPVVPDSATGPRPVDPPVGKPPRPAAGTLRMARPTPAALRRFLRTGKLRLSVSGLSPRTKITARVDALHGKKAVRLASGSRSVARSTSARLSLAMSRRGRAVTKKTRPRRLRVSVRASGSARTVTAVFTVPVKR
jgi:hypothetical protein